ncbi:carbon starvation protein a [Pyrococcus sp. NA2]|uniref:carbon starvation CstA family protein n=1 Tax=Pyrococcus sp. (strain NA2) TaxID=342949 RepID=UPI000209AFFF|nr:carbon starvation protein A [Pyrococcus sp. NA2]AEC52400.1 carbon starvation protein a [Pyrococcus sp. NA2]
MNSTVIILVAGIIYVSFYFMYGKGLQNKVVKADPNRPTPAHKLYDGVDYVPAHPLVLYGHHFASIAGAGPIVGPAVAMAWGWIPALLWVWFGNAFIGAVHDYLALMSSVRYDGKSIQWIAGKLMSKRTSMAFELYVWFALLLVIAAFAAVIAGIFVKTPGAATASILFLIIAVILGWLLYKVQVNFKVGTLIGIILLILAIYIGFKFPIVASAKVWYIFLGIYVIVASSLPVWVLLQPRDYLNAYILWFGLALGGLAFFVIGFKGLGAFTAPGFTTFSAHVVGGKPSPFWPTVPLVIACGALSGFHSLVGSGTSSKQLDNELHGLLVGYGGMFTEGFLSTIVISSIAVYGFQVFHNAGIGITAETWARAYAPLVAAKSIDSGLLQKLGVAALETFKNGTVIGKVGIFATSYAYGLRDAFGIDPKLGALFASLWVSAFALTTLDTATRLGRFAWQEIIEMVKGPEILRNKWIASFILVALGIALAWKGSWLIIWPAFSGMNQMLASIAMMTASIWVAKIQRPGGLWKWAVLIPALFLWVTVTAALLWFLIYVGRANVWVSIITIIGLALNFLLVIDWYRAWKKPAEEYQAAPA